MSTTFVTNNLTHRNLHMYIVHMILGKKKQSNCKLSLSEGKAMQGRHRPLCRLCAIQEMYIRNELRKGSALTIFIFLFSKKVA